MAHRVAHGTKPDPHAGGRRRRNRVWRSISRFAFGVDWWPAFARCAGGAGGRDGCNSIVRTCARGACVVCVAVAPLGPRYGCRVASCRCMAWRGWHLPLRSHRIVHAQRDATSLPSSALARARAPSDLPWYTNRKHLRIYNTHTCRYITERIDGRQSSLLFMRRGLNTRRVRSGRDLGSRSDLRF